MVAKSPYVSTLTCPRPSRHNTARHTFSTATRGSHDTRHPAGLTTGHDIVLDHLHYHRAIWHCAYLVFFVTMRPSISARYATASRFVVSVRLAKRRCTLAAGQDPVSTVALASWQTILASAASYCAPTADVMVGAGSSWVHACIGLLHVARKSSYGSAPWKTGARMTASTVSDQRSVALAPRRHR